VDPDLRRPLAGYTVGITGHRRWEEQAEMLVRRGARVVHGPTMATGQLGDTDVTLDATRVVLAAPVDLVVLTTGIGVRSWFAAAESAGLDDDLRVALSAGRVIARGPKALNAARQVGLEVQWTAPSETSHEMIATLRAEGIDGRRVVVQRDGGGPVVADAVRALGPAEVIDVPVYRWHVPADVDPAIRLLELAVGRQLDAVTFTCSYAVHNAFQLCPDVDGLSAAFNDGVTAVAVGPVTAATLRSHGVVHVVEPQQRARLGAMVLALVEHFAGRSRLLAAAGDQRRWQGAALVAPDGTETELTAAEARLLETLVEHAPSVVPKSALIEPGVDEHAAEAGVARLRAKLGPLGVGIRTVRRRGYACTLTVS
jgi:uroporphyrinogen-III synthase